jgi:hypothetical protein
MNAIKNLWNAFANLANAVNGLAVIVTEASNRLRVQLDYEPPMPMLPHAEVIENATADNASTKRRKAS